MKISNKSTLRYACTLAILICPSMHWLGGIGNAYACTQKQKQSTRQAKVLYTPGKATYPLHLLVK